MIKALAVLILYILVQTAYADEFATTESDKRIILKDDGTWEYAPIKNGEKAISHGGKTVIVNSDGTWALPTETNPETVQKTNQEVNTKNFCDQNVKVHVDKMSKNKYSLLKESILISENGIEGLVVSLVEGTSGMVIFGVNPVGAGSCIDSDEKMELLFRNGEIMTLRHSSDFNCEKNWVTYFGGEFKQTLKYDLLKNNELETIRVWTNDGYVQEDLSPETSKKLMNSFKCFLTE